MNIGVRRCEIWFLTLREEHRPRVFEDRDLMRIFAPKRDEVKRRMEEVAERDEHNNLHSFINIIRQIKSRIMMWAGLMARVGDDRKVCKVFVGKHEGKRPLGRPWQR
jgi:hypothetical protein